MSGLYDAGSTAFITLWTKDDAGTPVDADTTPTATLTVTSGTAAGTVTSLVVSSPDTGVYTIGVPLPVPGDYTLTTTATVAGSTRVDVRQLAALDPATAPGGLPAWAPSLADVADHIPTRTRPTAEWGSSDDMLGTFTDATTPNRDQALRLIGRACAWVAGHLGSPVYPAAYGVASAAAALRAAYWVEVAYPERTQDLGVYDRLATEATAAATIAAQVNAAAGATISDPEAMTLLPLFEFTPATPPPVTVIYPWHTGG